MKLANLVILHARTRNGEWKPVLPANVPAWVKEPDVIGKLVGGFMVTEKGNRRKVGWYRAERLPDSPIIMPGAPKLSHGAQAYAAAIEQQARNNAAPGTSLIVVQ